MKTSAVGGRVFVTARGRVRGESFKPTAGGRRGGGGWGGVTEMSVSNTPTRHAKWLDRCSGVKTKKKKKLIATAAQTAALRALLALNKTSHYTLKQG